MKTEKVLIKKKKQNIFKKYSKYNKNNFEIKYSKSISSTEL